MEASADMKKSADRKRVRLLGICCNWSPFACYNAAGMARLAMPPDFRLMRVMCIGRINQALILRAFEYGADGVILLECLDDDCRYGPGPGVGHENVRRVRKLLHLLGIGQERLVECSFGAHEKEVLVETLWRFARPDRGPRADDRGRRPQGEEAGAMSEIDRIIRDQSLFQCLECGKCSAACPRRLTGKEYSPRLLAHKVIAEREDEAFIENAVWDCLSCGMCSERCPSGVKFSGFILDMRTLLAETKGLQGLPGP